MVRQQQGEFSLVNFNASGEIWNGAAWPRGSVRRGTLLTPSPQPWPWSLFPLGSTDATTLDQLSAAVPTAPQSGGNFEYDGAPPSPYLAFPGTPASASYGTPASSVYGFGARQNSSTMLAMLAGQGNIPHAYAAPQARHAHSAAFADWTRVTVVAFAWLVVSACLAAATVWT